MSPTRLLPAVLLAAALWAGTLAAAATSEQATGRRTLPLFVCEQLQTVQKQLDDGNTAGAIAQLEGLSQRVDDDGLAFGIVQQYLVNAYLQADQAGRARAAAEQALARQDLAPGARLQLTYSAGRLALIAEDYPAASQRLGEWLAAETHPNGEAYYLLGYANYRIGAFKEAEIHLRNAVALGPASEGWYELLLAVLIEQQDHAAAAEFLTQRIGAQPDGAEQWKRLASLYLGIGREEAGLAVMLLARRSGLLAADEELEHLLRLHRHIGVPERAARLLARWLDEGTLAPSPPRWMTLAELWLEARERSAAKTALAKAAGGAADGRAADLLGRLEFEDENWQAAADAFQQARRHGGVEAAEQSTLLLGIAALRSGQRPLARRVLEEAAAQPTTAKQARYWLQDL